MGLKNGKISRLWSPMLGILKRQSFITVFSLSLSLVASVGALWSAYEARQSASIAAKAVQLEFVQPLVLKCEKQLMEGGFEFDEETDKIPVVNLSPGTKAVYRDGEFDVHSIEFLRLGPPHKVHVLVCALLNYGSRPVFDIGRSPPQAINVTKTSKNLMIPEQLSFLYPLWGLVNPSICVLSITMSSTSNSRSPRPFHLDRRRTVE